MSGFTPLSTEEFRPDRFCTTCGKVHGWPEPKFSTGQKVLVGPGGYHHQDKIGQVVTIAGIHTWFSDPCDELEYWIEGGNGAILESRLKAVKEVVRDE